MVCPEGFPNDGHVWRRIRRMKRGGIPTLGLYAARCADCGLWHIRTSKKWRDRAARQQDQGDHHVPDHQRPEG